MITQMVPFDPVSAERRGADARMTGDRVIDAGGKYVMPGMIDLHMHLRTQPMEIEYVRYFDPVQASSRWGFDHGAGVIYVASRRD